MKKAREHKGELPDCLKKLGIVLPQANTNNAKVENRYHGSRKDKTQMPGKDKGVSTYREDFKNFSGFTLKSVIRGHEDDLPNINTVRGVSQIPPSSPLTTTFRSSYKGEHGAPAVSCRPKWSAQPPHKPGPSGYSIDFAAKPLKRRSPPPSTKRGNVLDTYPKNVLLPYTRPEQVVTVWKPFPVLPPVKNGLQTSDLLDLLSKDSYSSTYRQDYVKRQDLKT